MSRDVVFDNSASWYLPPTPDLNSNPGSDNEVSEAEMPPDERAIRTREESPISFRLSGPNGRLSRRVVETRSCIPHTGSREDGLCARKKGRRRCRIAAQIGTSRIDASPTPKKAVTGLRERSPLRPRRPQHRRMSNCANLPARTTGLSGSHTTSTWRITMRT